MTYESKLVHEIEKAAPSGSAGFHGTPVKIPIEAFTFPEVYLAHDYDLADAYADGGQILVVENLGTKPLMLDTPEKFRDAWIASRVDEIEGPFSRIVAAFSAWARDEGYDHVVIPAGAFDEGADPWTHERQKLWELVAGTVGDPQTIILDPELARIVGSFKATPL